ncbi:hypothetical protein PG984_015212 [Apiospora sp. TS-2023a]
MPQQEASCTVAEGVGDNMPIVEAKKTPVGVHGTGNNQREEVTTKSANAISIDDGAPGASTGSKGQTDPGLKPNPTISRRCPITHKPHSHLAGFNMKTCPACGQELLSSRKRGSNAATETGYSSSNETGSYSSDGLTVERPYHDIDDTTLLGDALVKNTVSFLNTRGSRMRSVPWPETFNLQEERTNLRSVDLAFEIITALQTSIPSGAPLPKWSSRGSSGQRKVFPAVDVGRELLNDPLLDITIRRISLLIHSKALVEIIKSVVSYYPGVNLDSKPVRLIEPFPIIVHHLPQLESILRSPDAVEIVPSSRSWTKESKQLVHQQLEAFLEFFKRPSYTSLIEEEDERNARGYCTFRMLWYLFRPGSTVYLSRDGRLGAHIIAKVSVDKGILRPEVTSAKPYEISLWYLDFDGRHIGRCAVSVSIPAFEGERAITSLKIFPVEYRDKMDGGKTRRELEAMGKQWFQYLLGTQAHYKGEFMGPIGRQFDGRVFIDNVAYIEKHSVDTTTTNDTFYRRPPPPPPRRYPYGDDDYDSDVSYQEDTPKSPSYKDIPILGEIADLGEGLSACSCDDCCGKRVHPPPGFQWTDYDLINPTTTTSLELPGCSHGKDHRYFLCSRRLFGFVFKSRKWGKSLPRQLHLPNLGQLELRPFLLQRSSMSNAAHPPHSQPGAINSLVMPEDRKTIIKAIVEQYNTASSKERSSQRKQWSADYIESKGEGQMFLLHECIAEFTGRPLLSLTVGDIGTTEEKVEDKLYYWFNLAEKWGAVMLIDEADVYLERRTTSDLERNGIVSIFLRSMEYYRGILFLTTNRVGQFDDAFVSRIHLIIHYSPLGEPERRTIWSQFFEKLEDERSDISITGRARNYVLDDPEIRDVEWNGREIRNAFQTAVALADYEFSAKENKKEHEIAQLDQKHFQKICKMALQFKGYLTSLHGADEHTRAYQMRARNDGPEE